MKFIFVLLLFLFVNSFAQQSKIDSLRALLKKSKEDTTKVNILSSLADELYLLGRYDESLSYINEGIELGEELNYMHGLALLYRRSGDYYKFYNNYTNALQEYTKALELETLDERKEEMAICRDKLAKVYLEMEQFPKVIFNLEDALRLYEHLKDTIKMSKSLIALWDIHYKKTNSPEKAYEYIEKVHELASKISNDTLLADLYNKLSNFYSGEGNYEKSGEFLNKSLHLYEETGDKIGLATVYNDMAGLYEKAGNYQKSLEYLLKDLKVRIELGDTLDMATAYNNAGWGYQLTGNYASALDFQLIAMKFYIAVGDEIGLSYPLGNIGIIYNKLGDYHNAIKYSNEAITLFERTKYYVGIAEAHNNIGNAYRSMKKYDKALEHLHKGLTISMGAQDNYEVKNSYEGLFSAYEAMGDYKNACRYQKLFFQLKDSIINVEQQKELTRHEMNYNFEKIRASSQAEQDKKDAVQKSETRRQKIVLILTSGFLGLALVFAGFIFRSLRITRKQKQIIEIRGKETEEQKKIVENKNKNITDSITYAKRIQESFLLSEDEINKIFPYKSFVFFQPKDIVSGDFYWFSSVNNNGNTLYVAAVADCTGHGVPGAFLSMMGNMLLNEIVIEKQITDPALILKEIHHGIFNSLHRENESDDSLDGMDIAICVIDPVNKVIRYAGAMNPLYILRQDKKLEVIKANIFSLGGKVRGSNMPKEIVFTNHEISLDKGIRVYLFSDGYMDQFNTRQKLRFGSKQFKQLLVESAHLPMKAQKQRFAKAINDWMESDKQIDDILVMGIEV